MAVFEAEAFNDPELAQSVANDVAALATAHPTFSL